MNRELHFRAWDGVQMHYDVVPWRWDFVIGLSWHRCEESTGSGILGSGGKTGKFLVPGIAFKEVMQWTGLHDKNGKEIFEGDICRLVNAEGYEHYENMAGIRAVEWNNENMALQFSGYVPLKWGGRESIEVIGNIYQNPELLK